MIQQKLTLESQIITLLGTGEVIRILGVSPTYLRKLVAQGRLPVQARTPRGVVLFDPLEVERLRAERSERRRAKELTALAR